MNSSILNFIKKINISSIAKNTGNTLNVVKKIIPVYKEVRPYITKEKSILKKDNKMIDNNIKSSNNKQENIDNNITFFN